MIVDLIVSGKPATVAFVNPDEEQGGFIPATEDTASLVKVIYKDRTTEFYSIEGWNKLQATGQLEKAFDPNQPRDKDGKWGGNGGGGTDSSSVKQVKVAASDLADAAQEMYDQWEQDEDGLDEMLGSGGICQDVADNMAGVLNELGVEELAIVSSEVGDQHVWVQAVLDGVVHDVDIPPSVYETGSGYNWKKRPGVKITSEHVVVAPAGVPLEEWRATYGYDKAFDPNQPRADDGTWSVSGLTGRLSQASIKETIAEARSTLAPQAREALATVVANFITQYNNSEADTEAVKTSLKHLAGKLEVTTVQARDQVVAVLQSLRAKSMRKSRWWRRRDKWKAKRNWLKPPRSRWLPEPMDDYDEYSTLDEATAWLIALDLNDDNY
jgi:hypothetical protein